MTDWNAVERWDRSYYLHNTAGEGDYAFVAVDRMDGNWLTLDEVYVPQLVLDLLTRNGLRNRFTIGTSAMIARAGEAVLHAVSKLLRRRRVQG